MRDHFLLSSVIPLLLSAGRSEVTELFVCFTGPLSKEIESQITKSPASNTRRPADKNLGPMLPITKEILQDFYKPFNEKLAKVLQKESFRWENNSEL